MSSDNERKKSTGDWPTIHENQWYAFAITSAIFTAIAICAAFCWVFGDGFDGEADLKKAQALAPFGVALFALVTFCSVAWRGSINARQANQSESEGRAKLLQEGAKLLAESEKASHVSAGIATLGVLVGGPDDDYAWQAMNLLADFIEDHMWRDHTNRHRPQISGVMRTGEQNGRNTDRDIYFDCTSYDPEPNYDDDDPVYWHFIPGFASLRYKSGIFAHDVHYELDTLRNVHFQHVEIRGWRPVAVDDRFHRCRFSSCDIASVSSLLALNNNQNYEYAFEQCDFSGCQIHAHDLINKDLRKQRNYYLAGRPPILVGSDAVIDWSEILLCENRKPNHYLF
ncbi:hypothetical protein G6M70_06020 [Agrobacterium tumefaciens]|uniref:hypothetical protein n=1 Tax=Agrobacterium tumefaciens TaxID=358 RepID=UPI001573F7BB|nr:hypothetical protein [Agrobacterium tumefaciens]NSZ00625.1 hypothetical protein [Agrobacterium tumefaciens]NSZ38119.1 hypothetical protein [Agrobacterium tumefaciens]NTB25634.1 hypothetical protein [Agrobacterium tumefaciens]NTB27023.1 hypothetical protein [Agrobacterium tumefaciens]NTB32351.1 hypothetical protein [Agrobacterium tumefaciens]